jgi:hypothetical protein
MKKVALLALVTAQLYGAASSSSSGVSRPIVSQPIDVILRERARTIDFLLRERARTAQLQRIAAQNLKDDFYANAMRRFRIVESQYGGLSDQARRLYEELSPGMDRANERLRLATEAADRAEEELAERLRESREAARRAQTVSSAQPSSSSQVEQRPSSSSSQVIPSVRPTSVAQSPRVAPAPLPASSSRVVQPIRAAAPVVASISDAELKRIYTRAARNPAGVAKETALVARVERAAANGNQTAQGIMRFLQSVR